MRQEHYKVKYLNGKEESFYCIGFTEAIILGMAYARNMGWDMQISKVTDENNHSVNEIQFPEFKNCK